MSFKLSELLIFNSILESGSLKLERKKQIRTEYNNNQYKIQQKKLRIKRTFAGQRIESEKLKKKITINDELSGLKIYLLYAFQFEQFNSIK
jgi:hypothetical protein